MSGQALDAGEGTQATASFARWKRGGNWMRELPATAAVAGQAWVAFGMGRSGKVARLAGIEPTTLGFGGRYSIH